MVTPDELIYSNMMQGSKEVAVSKGYMDFGQN